MNSFSNVLYLKGRLWGDLITVFSYLMGLYKEGDRLFVEVHSDTKEGNRHKGQDRKISLDTWKKNPITTRMVKHWKRLPRQAVESPSLKIFRTHMVRP